VPVAPTGDGGADLFAGQPSMAAGGWHRAFAHLPNGLRGALRRGAAALPAAATPFRDFLAALDYGADARNQALIGGLPPARLSTFLSREVRSRLEGFDPYGDVATMLARCRTAHPPPR